MYYRTGKRGTAVGEVLVLDPKQFLYGVIIDARLDELSVTLGVYLQCWATYMYLAQHLDIPVPIHLSLYLYLSSAKHIFARPYNPRTAQRTGRRT